ncbi:MAG: AAA family ATPase [Janthinobacterium lividum]
MLFVCIPTETIEAILDAADARQWTVNQATFEVYISSRRRPHFPDNLKAGDGCVALIDFEADPEQAAAAAAYLHQTFQGRIVIMAISSHADPSSMLAAMRAGCTEFLSVPLEKPALLHAFHRVEQHLTDHTTTPHAAGSVLALLGAKGGVGTTTLGVHLAIFLVQNNKKKVLLIDSKAQFGHACIYLGMDGSACHFQEVVGNIDRLDSELLGSFVGKHVSGLDLLSSPDVGQIARSVHAEDVTATLEFLCTVYDFVIVDCDNSMDDITRAVIAASSQVYLVATPDITAIRDLSRHVDDLARLDHSSKIRVVINRYSSQFAVSLEEIERAIRLPVSFNVPNNYVELVRSANLGVPVSAETKSGFTSEITKWASSLVGAVTNPFPLEHAAARSPRIWKALKGVASTLTSHTALAGKRA